MDDPEALPRKLDDRLTLRRATPADRDALAAFSARVHGRDGELDAQVGVWARDLLSGGHPAIGPADFTIVEDATNGAIASTLCHISQTWTYDGIPFGVGRVELVGTDPAYRRRGLVRTQLDALHAESARRGERVQGITGIRWYYRQFGYEYALAQGGGRAGTPGAIRPLPEGAAEPFRVRPATAADLGVIARIDAEAARRDRVACTRDAALWRYELDGRSHGYFRPLLCVIETAAGQPVGYLLHRTVIMAASLSLVRYELAGGVSWGAVTPSVLRYLAATADALARRDDVACAWIAVPLGPSHPVYAVTRDSLPVSRPPYAWYIRVADIPGFLAHIAPALERRLADSPLAGHSGTLALDCYRDGVRLIFAAGRLTDVAAWRPPPGTRADAAFPPLTFLQLLFGHRTLDDLTYAYPDCYAAHETAYALIAALFPRHDSHVWGVE